MKNSVVPDRFLHATVDDRTALCDGRILVNRDAMTVEDFGLPACSRCVSLYPHVNREIKRARKGRRIEAKA